MAPGSDGDYRKEATSYQPLMEETTTTMRQLLTTSSIGTLTSPAPSLSSSSSSDPPGDSLHSRSPLTLPFDLVVEILCRLPVKLLMQLRCVCKSWNSLIFDPKFAKRHLRWSRTLFSRHHLVGRDCRSREKCLLWDSTLPSVFNSSVSTSIPETQLSYPINHGRDCYDMIVGSCDGILCFTTGKLYSSILVWNPSIRKFKILPPSEINQPGSPTPSYTIYGFGYDHLTDNYKMVAVCSYQWDTSNWVSKTMVKVHTLGTNSWRRIQGFPSTLLGFPVVTESGKFVSGTINWLVSTAPRSSWAIVSLDLGKESYQELLQPDYGGGVAVWTLTLGVLRDCLCVLSHIDTFLDVWVMKDYGNKESWTKLFTFPYKELLCCGCLYSARARYISEDDQVLLNFVDGMDEIVVYNSRNGTVKFPELQYILSDWFVTDVYVESLISP